MPPVCFPPGKNVPFAWHEPTHAPRLEIRREYAHVSCAVVNFDLPVEGSSHSGALVGLQDAQGAPLHYRVYAIGPTKVFEVTSGAPDPSSSSSSGTRPRIDSGSGSSSSSSSRAVPGNTDWRNQRQPPHLTVNVRLAGLGISVVAPILQRIGKGETARLCPLRSELFFISIEKVSCVYKSSKTHEDLELKLQEVQVDNQREDALYPVLFCRSALKSGVAAALESTSYSSGPRGPLNPQVDVAAAPLVHICMNRRRDKDLLYFDFFGVLLQEIDLRFDSRTIMDLQEVLRWVLEPYDAKRSATSPIGSRSASGWTSNLRPQKLLETDVTGEGRKLHFDEFMVHPMKVNLSFTPGAGMSSIVRSSEFAFFIRLFASLSSVDNSPLRFNILQLRHATPPLPCFKTVIQEHYREQFMSEIGRIAGSLEVIGNPLGLVKNIGTGVLDVFYEPYQGLMRSPDAAVEGVARGAGSLVKNTVFGTFNTVSKIAGAASQGLGVLSMDEDYQLSRQRFAQRHQPQHVGDGLFYGLKSLARGVKDGVKGMAAQPARGLEEDGVEGMFRGVGKGLMGLVVKPAAGVLDLTKQTAEGIRNSTEFFDAPKRTRVRLPRMLYGLERVMRSYNLQHAQLRVLLGQVDASLGTTELVDHVWDKGRGLIVLCTANKLVLISEEQKKKTF